MMLYLGILMVYLIGAGLLARISGLWSWKEMIAYSFLLGIAAETFFMFLCDVIGFHFTGIVLFFAGFAVIVACYDSLYAYWQGKKKDINLGSWSFKTLNYPAVLLGSVIFYLFWIITQKNLFWPTLEHDSIASFDKLGRVMAVEGVVRISLFKYGLEGSGGVYPPLFQGAIAYLHLYGDMQHKIITTLFFISILLGFYAICRKYVSSINALFFTLLLEMVPELYSHAALLLDNLPTTAYVGNAALVLFVWLQTGERRYFILSCILTGLSLWIRNDTIGFALAGALVIILFAMNKDKWKEAGIYLCSAILPFIVWTLYLRLKVHTTQGARFIDHIGGLHTAKLKIMSGYLLSYFSWIQYGTMAPGIQLYGLTFMLSFLLIALNIRHIKKDRPYIGVFLLVSFAVYFMIFLLLDEQKQNAPISSLMESSFKRGMFCFIPPLLFYVSASTFVTGLSERLEAFRTGIATAASPDKKEKDIISAKEGI
jgi:hypothetical protein